MMGSGHQPENSLPPFPNAKPHPVLSKMPILRRMNKVLPLSPNPLCNPFSSTTTINLATHFSRVVDTASIASWNAAISDLARSDHHADALRAFSSLRRLNITPDRSTFPPAIKSAASLPSLPSGLQLHLLSLLLGFSPSDLFVSSSLVNLYSKCGLPRDARHVFDECPLPNTILYTSLVTGYVSNSSPLDAVSLFREMLCDLGSMELDSGAIISVLTACGRISARKLVCGVHGLAVKVGLEREAVVGNALMDAYAKGRMVEVSRKVFDGMAKDVVSWNTMVAVYAQNGLATDATEVYLEMVRCGGVRVNAVTLSAVLLACAHGGALQVGKYVHDQVVQMGLEENVYVGTSVVDMYCKCGRVEMARKAFDRIKDKNVKSFSALIAGYGMHSRGREALDVLDEMLKSGVTPNRVTFVSVLAACSHSSLLDEGRYWFKAMKIDFGIEPAVEHYGCIVDLLGRAGCLAEAYRLIKEMKVKPDVVVWGALLSACRIHRNVELGEISAKKLFELDSKNCGFYVSLLNIYADAGRWKDVEKMRGLIKSRGVVKTPGHSLVELKGKSHMFMVGDRRHPQHEEIHSYLEKLRVRMQEAGYVPDTGSVLHDVDQEEKETVLRVHSEKLAVAFAILNTVPGSSILIIKNLRVCGDCHSAIKLIAKLEGREIVARDSHQFHHFRDGLCSCGDYW